MDIDFMNNVRNRRTFKIPKRMPLLESNIHNNIMEAVVEPVVETIVEPVVETIVEPVVETNVEPVVETIVEPVLETIVEPVLETNVVDAIIEPIHNHGMEKTGGKHLQPKLNIRVRYNYRRARAVRLD